MNERFIGKRLEPILLESLFMGCVSYTLRFFPDGRVDRKRFAAVCRCGIRPAQAAQQEAVACHELLHVKRRDAWTLLLEEGARAVRGPPAQAPKRKELPRRDRPGRQR